MYQRNVINVPVGHRKTIKRTKYNPPAISSGTLYTVCNNNVDNTPIIGIIIILPITTYNDALKV